MVTRNPGKTEQSREPQMLIDEEIPDNEPTKEEILEGIRIGIRQALAGETTPIEQLFEEVRRELENDADAGSNQ